MIKNWNEFLAENFNDKRIPAYYWMIPDGDENSGDMYLKLYNIGGEIPEPGVRGDIDIFEYEDSDKCMEELGLEEDETEDSEEYRECVEKSILEDCSSDLYGKIFLIAIDPKKIDELNIRYDVPVLSEFSMPVPQYKDLMQLGILKRDSNLNRSGDPIFWIEEINSMKLPMLLLEVYKKTPYEFTKIFKFLNQEIKNRILKFLLDNHENPRDVIQAEDWGI